MPQMTGTEKWVAIGMKQVGWRSMIKLGELTADLANLEPSDFDLQVSTICVDSRQVTRGCLFAAMPGVAVDGATFVAKAIQQGAVAILVGASSKLPSQSSTRH